MITIPRENILPNAGVPRLEVYNNFSGGLNSETANEQLRPDEFPQFENVNMDGRGSARRRTGRVDALTSFPTGNAQGIFPFFTSNTTPDLLLAVSGQFYLIYATPKSFTSETPTGSGPTYTLANKWVQKGTITVDVSGTAQTFVDNPTDEPVLNVMPGNTSLQAGEYTVGYTFTNSLGETALSPTSTITIQTGEQIRMNPISFPTGVTGLNVYMSDADYSSTLTLRKGVSISSEIVMLQQIPSSSQPTPPSANTATVGNIDYANGTITFNSQPSATPTVTYSSEMESLSITGLSGGFQTTDNINAAEYNGKLYLATGTKFCVYDGTSVSTVTPYTPTPMEAIWIGTNGLAANPNAYIADGTQTSGISVVGIQPQYNPGAVQQANTMTAFVNKASSITSVDYQWQYKKSSDTSWTTGLAWTTGANTYSFTPPTAENYDISVQARDTSTTTTTSNVYELNDFPINATPKKPDYPVDTMQTCKNIIVYWDRILLVDDSTYPTQMYVSDLRNPEYFPVDNVIDWDTGNGEPITSMVQFRNMLIVFTRTTIQALEGEAPANYKRQLIHPYFGALAGRSVQVINNEVYFLSAQGVLALQPNMFLTYFNVTRIDYQIRNEILDEIDEYASSMFYDNQYWLCIPSKSYVYRFYFDYKAWVKDTSTQLNLNQFYIYGQDVYDLTQDSKLRKYDWNTYTDSGEIYTMTVKSKFLDFGEVFDYKKLKRVFVLAKGYQNHNVDIGVKVEADSAVQLTPTTGTTYIDNLQNTMWKISPTPNFHFYSGSSLGSWVLGSSPIGTEQVSVQMASLRGTKNRRTRITFTHTQGNECEIYGFAFQFSLRRPY